MDHLVTVGKKKTIPREIPYVLYLEARFAILQLRNQSNITNLVFFSLYFMQP